MKQIKTYEGFLDLFKSGLTMVGDRVNKFLDGKRDLKTNKSKSEIVWTWVEEVSSLGDFDFRLVLSKSDDSFRFTITSQSKSNPDLNSKSESGRWAFSKLSDFDDKLNDILNSLIRKVGILAVCDYENKRFLEDFTTDDVWDYLIDLKDLVNGEVEINFEKAGIFEKGLIRETPSYKVTIKGITGESVDEIERELKLIESNIKNAGLEIKGSLDVGRYSRLSDRTDRYRPFNFSLVRKV